MKQDIYDLTVEHILDNQDKAYRLAYSYVQDRDAALDVVQNAACQALEKCWGVKNPSALKTWYYKIVVNEALQYLRKNRREISTQPEDMKEEAYLEEGYDRADEDARVFAQVLELPPDMKTVGAPAVLRAAEPCGNRKSDGRQSEYGEVKVVCGAEKAEKESGGNGI